MKKLTVINPAVFYLLTFREILLNIIYSNLTTAKYFPSIKFHLSLVTVTKPIVAEVDPNLDNFSVIHILDKCKIFISTSILPNLLLSSGLGFPSMLYLKDQIRLLSFL